MLKNFGRGSMTGWWYRFNSWRQVRSMLLVCAGSGPGRVPLAFSSRDDAAGATIAGSEVRFSSVIGGKIAWHFTLVSATPELAKDLAGKLARRRIHSVHPDDRIAAIVFRRDDWESVPLWIGGDISRIDVDRDAYLMNGNKAYIHKRFAEQKGANDGGGLPG